MSLPHIIAIFSVGAISSFLISLLAIRSPASRRWLSRVDFRRKHQRRIPQLGGVAILIPLVYYATITPGSSMREILLAAIPLLVVGIFDDIFELSAKPKMLAQVLSVTAWLWLSKANDLVLTQAGFDPLLAQILTGFWVVGMINAMNMIDGMDGLAGTFALVTAGFLSLLGRGSLAGHDMAIFAGALTGFLLLNRPPARIYLGDLGSTFVGFVLATYASMINVAPRLSSLFIPLLLMAYPAIDACLAISRRLVAKSPITQGDREHIHHKMLKVGLSVNRALLFVAAGSLATGLAALSVFKTGDLLVQLYMTGAMTIALSALLAMLYYCEYRLALQISSLSRTIISEFLPINASPTYNTKKFRAISYDLLPYYKDLQQTGILAVKDFIRDLAEHLTKIHGESAQFTSQGSYTILVLEEDDSGPSANQIALGFQEVLKKHGVLKNLDRPWGLAIFAGDAGRELFLKKFSTLQKSPAPVSFEKVS